jgi:hypothetical protein
MRKWGGKRTFNFFELRNYLFQGPPNSIKKNLDRRTDGEKKGLENKILLTLDIHAFGLDNIIKKVHYLHIYTQYFDKALAHKFVHILRQASLSRHYYLSTAFP